MTGGAEVEAGVTSMSDVVIVVLYVGILFCPVFSAFLLCERVR
jgi:hypothetical protein